MAEKDNSMSLNNPYLYHPHPLCKAAVGILCSILDSHLAWKDELAKGKMLGVMIVRSSSLPRVHYINEQYSFIAAYSGVVNLEPLCVDGNPVFVPPIYDLSNPSDYYRSEERNISDINRQIEQLEVHADANKPRISLLKRERKERSKALQEWIFSRFNFVNRHNIHRNIIDIFQDGKRGLPPGGAGECAAPRLLQYAYIHQLEPIAMAEFWYGISPKVTYSSSNGVHQLHRVHLQFYPSCIEKCSPILSYMLDTPAPEGRVPEQKDIDIIYEDPSIIVVGKPENVLSAPAKDESLFNVESWLLSQRPGLTFIKVVHRLDQPTSGLLIAAKDIETYKTMQAMFNSHLIRKQYVAWVEGLLPSECGVINLPICPNPDERPRQVVSWQSGKTSLTRYRVLKRDDNRTLIELHPFTGRTHQLRLHCASPFGLDHPIVGDRLYTIAPYVLASGRLMLHAQNVTFPHPSTGKKMTFIVRNEEFLMV